MANNINTGGGFITLDRKILNWEWYDDANTMRVFLHLLLTANHEDKKWHGIDVKRGQRVTSLAHLAEETGLTVQQIRTAISHLKSTGEITTKSTRHYTVVTIAKYDFYQSKDSRATRKATRKPTSKQQATNKQPTTNNNDNNENNDNNKQKEAIFIPTGLQESMDAFMEMRKKSKSPLTDRALGMLLKKVNELSGGDIVKANAILDQSTINGWKSVYPLKETSKPKKTFADLYREGAMK